MRWRGMRVGGRGWGGGWVPRLERYSDLVLKERATPFERQELSRTTIADKHYSHTSALEPVLVFRDYKTQQTNHEDYGPTTC